MADPQPPRVTVGVDTHKDLHVAAARDQLGRRLGTTQVQATSAGYAELLGWARSLGQVQAWGVEGTGSYGAGLARFLAAQNQQVRLLRKFTDDHCALQKSNCRCQENR